MRADQTRIPPATPFTTIHRLWQDRKGRGKYKRFPKMGFPYKWNISKKENSNISSNKNRKHSTAQT